MISVVQCRLRLRKSRKLSRKSQALKWRVGGEALKDFKWWDTGLHIIHGLLIFSKSWQKFNLLSSHYHGVWKGITLLINYSRSHAINCWVHLEMPKGEIVSLNPPINICIVLPKVTSSSPVVHCKCQIWALSSRSERSGVALLSTRMWSRGTKTFRMLEPALGCSDTAAIRFSCLSACRHFLDRVILSPAATVLPQDDFPPSRI